MGVSSNNNEQKQDSYIPAVLISLSKIKEFNKYFEFKNDKSDKNELTNIFNSLIHSINLLDGHVLEFKKIKDKHIKGNISIKKLLTFILDKLHDELNDKKKSKSILNNKVINYTNESESYKEFSDFHYKYNHSVIQDLFFGEKELISRCSICKKTMYDFEINKLLYFDIHSIGKEMDLSKLLQDYLKQKEEIAFCKSCQKDAEMLSRIVIKKLPEIFIFCFDNIMDMVIFNYYLTIRIQDESYKLICFIIDADENNKKDRKYNVFYLENDKWFIYNVTKKEEKEIKDITNINKNPLVTFYQKKITHDKILVNKLYNNINSLMKNLLKIPKLIKEHIADENKFENYYIINNKWFNKLTKIFESEEIYQNDNLILDSFDQITNVPNLNNNDIKEKIKLVQDRLQILNDEKIFIPGMEKNEESGIEYPIDFIIIKENELKEILINFNIKIKDIEKNLYKLLFGENYLFIKTKNKNIFFICYSFLFLFNVEKIFRFNDQKYFSREIGNYIKNKGGIDYYLQLRQLDINNNKIQPIIDREKENIGDFINIISNKTLVNVNKYILGQIGNSSNFGNSSMRNNTNIRNNLNFSNINGTNSMNSYFNNINNFSN